MERTITVIGKGNIILTPDMIKISIHLNHYEKKYEQTIQQSALMKDELTSSLCKLGFKETDLKTTSFSIDSKYEGYSDEHGNWKNRFVGYEFNHDLEISFTNFDLLGEVLSMLAKCSSNPEFSIHYTVQEQEEAKNELLARAVKDAKTKAEVLAKAGNVTLKELISMDYSWVDSSFEIQPVERVMLAKSTLNSIDLNIQPSDIIASEQVSVVWRIE